MHVVAYSRTMADDTSDLTAEELISICNACAGDSDVQITGTSLDESCTIVENANSSRGASGGGQVPGLSRNQSSCLDDLDRHVQERYRREQEKIDAQYTKRDVEKAHSKYLRQNMSTAAGLAEASAAVDPWAQRHSFKSMESRQGSKSKSRPAAGSSRSNAAGTVMDLCSDSPVQGSTAAEDGDVHAGSVQYQCPVLNCEAKFSSQDLHKQHIAEFFHTPCHPYLHVRNLELKPRHTTHICPVCGNIYMDQPSCQDHMRANGHDILMHAQFVAAYACPQCLLCYAERQDCQIHMDNMHHGQYCYPFSDDLEGEPKPVPFPPNILEAFVKRCHRQPWQTECLTCNCKVWRSKEGQAHFDRRHNIVALTDFSPADVFSYFLRAYTCVQCLRLFEKLPPEGLGAVHHCGGEALGMIVENDCKAFNEFVRRMDITLENEKAARQEAATLDSAAAVDDVLCEDDTLEEAVILLGTDGTSAETQQTNQVVIPDSDIDCTTPDAPVNLVDEDQMTSPASEVRSESPDVVLLNKKCASFRSDDPKKSTTISACPVGSVKPKTAQRQTAVYAGPSTQPSNSVPDDRCARIPVPRIINHSLLSRAQGGARPKVIYHKTTSSNQLLQPDVRETNDIICDENDSLCSTKKRQLSEAQSQRPAKKYRYTSGGPVAMTSSGERNVVPSKNDETVVKKLSELKVKSPVCSVISSEGTTSGKQPIMNIQQIGKNVQSSAQTSTNLPLNAPTFPSDLSNNNITSKKLALPNQSCPRGELPLMTQTFENGNKAYRIPRQTRWDSGIPEKRGHISPLLNPNVIENSQNRPNLGPRGVAAQGSSQEALHLPNPQNNPPTVEKVNNPPPSQTNQDIPKNLEQMKHIVFLDLDNWPSFFSKLPGPLPEKTFVWGFYGGSLQWREPFRCISFQVAKENGWFHLHRKCGRTKDAADFAICMQVGRMDERLPENIPFTILSGDHGFRELENQMEHSHRRAVVINPHHQSSEMVYMLLSSVADA